MKKMLFAAAAAVAFLGSAVAANAQVIGSVGANYSRAEVDASGLGEINADIFRLDGAVRFDAGSLGAQIDAAVASYDGDDESFGATGHLNTNVGNALVGGFAGVETSGDLTLWGLGVEGQANLAPTTTLYGQAGYGSIDDADNLDIWAARAELRHYFTDSFKVAGGGGLLLVEADDDDFTGWNLGVEAEYQVAQTPFSVVAGYDHLELNDVGLDSDTFRVGFRYTFGGSIRERDQAGAALGSVSRLFGTGLIR